jgi:carbonic anhydrase
MKSKLFKIFIFIFFLSFINSLLHKNENKKEESNSLFNKNRNYKTYNENDNNNNYLYQHRKNFHIKKNFPKKNKNYPSSNYRFSESKFNLKSAIEAEFSKSYNSYTKVKAKTNTNTNTETDFSVLLMENQRKKQMELEKEKEDNYNIEEEKFNKEEEEEENENEQKYLSQINEKENIYNINLKKNRMSNEAEEEYEEKKMVEINRNNELNSNIKNDNYDKNKNYLIELNDNNNHLIENWLTVESKFFRNKKFPELKTYNGMEKIELKENARINKRYNLSIKQGANSNLFFWFKFKKGYFYYFASKNDMNVLDAILIKSIKDKETPGNGNVKLPTCFLIYDYQGDIFEICASNMETKLNFLCTIENYLSISLDKRCSPKKINFILKKTVQEVIIIPIPSRECNENWNYINKGNDWECICKDGLSQSPIKLPKKEEAILTNLSPMFTYERVDIKPKISTIDNLVSGEENLNIRLEKNAIRIFHPNMGKIVMVDGSVFVAEEIVFHTPSEHIIDGKQYDLEMQVIHYGRSKGDISNQVVLSILFKNTPGKYNKFLDKIDFFNLPNYKDPIIELQNDFFIPSVFINSEEEDVIDMEPFSFYTYEGSLTFPPCTERTTYIVAANPIPLSSTVIKLFQEAIMKPNYDENVLNNKNEIATMGFDNFKLEENNREIQNLNDRKIYYFDCVLNGCLSYKPPKMEIKKSGHYEKVRRVSTQYILVYGSKPSGFPGSFLVSEDEAKGKTITRKIEN